MSMLCSQLFYAPPPPKQVGRKSGFAGLRAIFFGKHRHYASKNNATNGEALLMTTCTVAVTMTIITLVMLYVQPEAYIKKIHFSHPPPASDHRLSASLSD